MTLLNALQEILKQAEYEFIFVPASPQIFPSRLLILLGVDNKEREQKLEVAENIQFTSYATSTTGENSLPFHVQFTVTYPFQVKDLAINEVSSFLHYINRSINFPGFEFDELEGQVFYRYIWVAQAGHLTENIVKDILQAIKFNLSLFSDLIEKVAVGDSTFNDLLAEMIKKFEEKK